MKYNNKRKIKKRYNESKTLSIAHEDLNYLAFAFAYSDAVNNDFDDFMEYLVNGLEEESYGVPSEEYIKLMWKHIRNDNIDNLLFGINKVDYKYAGVFSFTGYGSEHEMALTFKIHPSKMT